MKRLIALILLGLNFTLPAYAADTVPGRRNGASVTVQPQAQAPAQLKIEGDENGPLSNELADQIYKDCKYNIPHRFTPEAREYYCSCNSASLQGNFLMKEYRELMQPGNRKPGNKTFEKYITTSVAPCLDMPVQQIEYLNCVLDSTIDERIGSVPKYCKCVSNKMRDHARLYTDTEIMTRLASYKRGYKDPVDALWNNPTYLAAKVQSRDDCIINGY